MTAKEIRPRADPMRDPFDDDDISDFTSGPSAKPKAPIAAVQEIGEAHGFTARRPAPPAARPQRRHRTGRNVQLNIKASRETIDAFIALSEAEGWVLGETLDHLLQNWKASK
jgi:hypothetical protein